MERAQTGVARVILKRQTEPLVECTYASVADRSINVYGSCGAMIPFKPKSVCPSCGVRQVQATVKRPPDDALILSGNVALIDADTNEVTAVQVIAVPDLSNRLADSLRQVRWDAPVSGNGKSKNEARLSGIVVTHRTFGYVPPVPLRRRYACTRSRFDYDYPEASALIDEYCLAAEHVFRTQAHEVYADTAQQVRDTIPQAWLIAGTPWSSGIINHTAALPYHRDSNNVKGSWSAMLSCRRGVDGGMLHLADYDVWLAVPNGSISIFDGQSVVHGVSPFRLTAANAYRYTLVTYARRGMKVCCANPAHEAQRAAIAATEASDRRRPA